MNLLKKLALPAFIVFQLAIIGNMVWEKTKTSVKGTEFKFRCAMYDPIQPFAGRYMQLNFDDPCVPTTQSKAKNPDYRYGFVTKDSAGFAMVKYVTDKIPENTNDYLDFEGQGIFEGLSYGERNCLQVHYPFERFYLNENDAPKAEKMVNQAFRDSSSRVWITVSVYKGQYVIKEIFVNDKSLKASLDD